MNMPPFDPLRGVIGPLRLLVLACGILMGQATAQTDDYAEVNGLVKAGQMKEALAKADQYLASKPRDPQMRFIKGVVLSESGKPAEAITVFSRLTEDYPELPEPYNNLAVLYAGQNQYDKARSALEMAIRTNPSYATAHENLGDIYARLASQAYSKALQLDSSNAGVPPKLGLIRNIFNTDTRTQRPAAAATPVARPPTVSALTVPAVAVPLALPAAQPSAPAATIAAPPPLVPAASADDEKEVDQAIKRWAAAWAAKDMSGYLAAYGSKFDTPGNQTRKAWEDERRARIVGKSRIAVTISDVNIDVNGDKARARFKQQYSADALNISSQKTLDLVKASSRWVIVRESTGG
jgi:Tfp pilus assembly protein PilF/ketosteroid isomerase-like protein